MVRKSAICKKIALFYHILVITSFKFKITRVFIYLLVHFYTLLNLRDGMSKTLAEQLDEVQTAISNILTGAQSVGHEGEVVSFASLDALQRREKYLLKRIAGESRTRRTLGEF